MNADEKEMYRFAIQVAQTAGQIHKRYYGKTMEVVQKSDSPGDIVTQADRETEEKIVAAIRNKYPTHGILGEEGASHETGSEYLWSIDPVDGTLSFKQGFPWFNVAIGVLKDNAPLLGVMHTEYGEDNKPETHYAMKGQGAFCNGESVSVSDIADLKEALVGYDPGKKDRTRSVEHILLRVVEHIKYPIIAGSASFILKNLARGKIDAYAHLNLDHWDIAAAAAIVTEAGGTVTDLKGDPLVWERNKQFDVLFSNTTLHGQLLELLNA